MIDTNFELFLRNNIPPAPAGNETRRQERRRIFKAVRNVLNNELGINRSVVQDEFRQMIEQYVTEYVNSPQFESYLKGFIAESVRRAYSRRLGRSQVDFSDVILREVEAQIAVIAKAAFAEKFSINLDIKEK